MDVQEEKVVEKSELTESTEQTDEPTITTQGEPELENQVSDAQLTDHDSTVQAATQQQADHERTVQAATQQQADHDSTVQAATQQQADHDSTVQAATQQQADHDSTVQAATQQQADHDSTVQAATQQQADHDSTVQTATQQQADHDSSTVQTATQQQADHDGTVQERTDTLLQTMLGIPNSPTNNSSIGKDRSRAENVADDSENTQVEGLNSVVEETAAPDQNRERSPLQESNHPVSPSDPSILNTDVVDDQMETNSTTYDCVCVFNLCV